jgi:multidrug resistance efflux pump
MTHPQQEPRPKPTLRLPVLSEQGIPAWRFTRHIAALSLTFSVVVALMAIVALSLVDMRVTVAADGVVEPGAITPVRSTESGLLSAMLVRTGESVLSGTIVARLDSLTTAAAVDDLTSQIKLLSLELGRATANKAINQERLAIAVTSAEAREAEARTFLRERMVNFGVTGDPDSVAAAANQRVHIGLDGPAAGLRAAKADLALARAQQGSFALDSLDELHKRAEIARLEAALRATVAHLRRQVIRAPADGTVLTDQIELLEGKLVSAGETILEIANEHTWQATLTIAEQDVHRVQIGDSADVEIPAYASLAVNRFRGTVREVGWQPDNTSRGSDSPSRSRSGFRIIVQLDTTALAPLLDGSLRRGYVAHAKIVTRSERALVVLLEKLRGRLREVAR